MDVFIVTLLNGQRYGLSGLSTAPETKFGSVLAGNADPLSSTNLVSHHVTFLSGDDFLHQFWEVEEPPLKALFSSLKSEP